MKVNGVSRYFGHNIYRKPVINRQYSGVHLLGVYASYKSNCLCVVKMYEDRIWDVLEEYVDYEIDIDMCIAESKRLVLKYEINYIFGNKYTPHVCIPEGFYNSSSQNLIKYELLKLDIEEMILLVSGNLKRINFVKELNNNWLEELERFDPDKPDAPRIFALSSVLSGAEWQYTMFNDSCPDILVDESGNPIVKEVQKINRNQNYNGYPAYPKVR